ncbi:MAG: DUF255 domain-containing protein [Anaerolineae bacterium]
MIVERVNWQPYGQVTFERARTESRPIVVMYHGKWCLWCRRFEKDTLHQPEIASYLNENFVCIQVDVDERPDLSQDQRPEFLPTVQLLSANGVPVYTLNGYRTPDAFRHVLDQVLRYHRDGTLHDLEPETRHPDGGSAEPATCEYRPLPAIRDEFLVRLENEFDEQFGGFGNAQKFPMPWLLDFLLELHEETGQEQWLTMVEQTLQAIAHGLYDPVEGGFFRYSVTADWTQPHFEKLLAPTATLGLVYLRAWQAGGDDAHRGRGQKALDYVLNVLRDPDGGFYGNQAAVEQENYFRFDLDKRREMETPPIDMTRYADANAQAIVALLATSDLLDEPRYAEAAIEALNFLRTHMIDDDGVYHYYRAAEGRPRLNGQLADSAWSTLAFLAGYEYTGDPQLAGTALRLLDYTLVTMYDEEQGGFFVRRSTSHDLYRADEAASTDKPLRENGVMAFALARSLQHWDDSARRETLSQTLRFLTCRPSENLEDYVYYLRAIKACTSEV